jgi:proteasome lid subunit RPN8/RPN11
MTLEINAALLKAIERHGEAAYPEEGCGILLGRAEDNHRVVTEVLPVENRREDAARHNRYLIPPEAVVAGEEAAGQKGLDVIGFFHSHPDHPAQPSAFDRDHAWPWYSYIITSVKDGGASGSRSWRLLDDRSQFVEEEIRYA